jgi:hypothetical protein
MDIHDYVESYMESQGIGKRKAALDKEGKGSSLLDTVGKASLLSKVLGLGKNLGKGMLPSATAAGSGYAGVGGVAAGIGGGLVLGAPIAALGLTLNHLWKKQQGVEDQEMASIVGSTGVNKAKSAERQRLWNEFAKQNGITRSQEESLSKDIDYENRQDQVNGLISKVRTGRAGKNLQDKWLKFLVVKRSGIPQVQASITMPTIPKANAPSLPMPQAPTENIILPSATESPTSLDNVTLANPNVDIQNLEPRLKGNLAQLSTGYKEETGEKLQVNSGARTYAEQAALKKVNKFAASPDRSPHVDRGEGAKAFDAQSRQINTAKRLGLMESAGLDTPVKNEPWHVQNARKPQPTLASVTDIPTPTPTKPNQQQASPTIISQTNVIQQPDYRFYLDDPYTRKNNNNGIT